jgi:hypothetical protein
MNMTGRPGAIRAARTTRKCQNSNIEMSQPVTSGAYSGGRTCGHGHLAGLGSARTHCPDVAYEQVNPHSRQIECGDRCFLLVRDRR